jgi:hypothetical protein
MNCPFCNIDVDQHEAERCMDAWIDRDLFGYDVGLFKRDYYRVVRRDEQGSVACVSNGVPLYNTTWNGMGKVFEQMNSPFCMWNDENGLYHIHFGNIQYEGYGNDAPLAVGRSALKTVNASKE